MILDPPLDYEVLLDADLDEFGIGIVGAGFIVRDCHIPAYLDAGFRVVGLTSRTLSRAEEVAKFHHLRHIYADLDVLLSDPQIQVVDVAVPPQAQPDVIRRIVSHGKHIRGILAQKPLAMSLAEAHELVELCESAGITLAVNQNMRHDQSVRACRDLLSRGLLGDPVLATIEMRAIPHWMPWSQTLHSLSTFVMSIHHIDTFRYWLGDPLHVLASTRPDPRTQFPHTDGLNLYIFEFENGPRASAWDDVWTGPAREGTADDISIRWRVEGTAGIARGTIGWPKYPEPTPSTIDYTIQDGS
ncbi:MAG: Gfo/Idh/MocA family oxidoreductase, partial [Planctomycetaceae bacterium]|nr:Gfo/Idh/MocA family oxidoreductase [Planctomycetaceae bacterium]